MKVTLLNSYPDESIAMQAAAMCVGKFEDYSESNLTSALASGHYSVIEHLPLTFVIEGISLSCSHQLVRHRHASFSQLSNRYTNASDRAFVFPPSVPFASETGKAIRRLYFDAQETYRYLVEEGVSKEDARLVLPNGLTTSLEFSTNARAFMEQAKQRLCHKAQWEIQELFGQAKELIKDVYPSVYKLCVPPCVGGKCKEAKPCGKPYGKPYNGPDDLLPIYPLPPLK